MTGLPQRSEMPEAFSSLAPLRIPARDIPVPSSISVQAQRMLARGPLSPPSTFPDREDLQGWLDYIEALNLGARRILDEHTQEAKGVEATNAHSVTETIDIDGVTVYIATPEGVDGGDRRVYLDIHGGSWIQGGGEFCKLMASDTAKLVGARTLSVDYRMPPGHPFPAALEDCLTVYLRLLQTHRSEEIIVGGASAGGNLAAALMLLIRDRGLPHPAAVVLNTPAVDLTESGDTWATNLGIDTVLTSSAKPTMLLYAGGHDLLDPYISPLYGDLAKGYPTAILLSGTRDLLLSDTVRFHRALLAADIPAELHVFEAQGHGGFLGEAPEDQDRALTIRKFIDSHWPRTHC